MRETKVSRGDVLRVQPASEEAFVLHLTRETPDGSPPPLFEVTTATTATGRTAAKPPLMRLEPWRSPVWSFEMDGAARSTAVDLRWSFEMDGDGALAFEISLFQI
nr:hypothetical protein Iba_chr11cCG2500 [Ipomoea batatas]